jgi:hypothetical protein
VDHTNYNGTSKYCLKAKVLSRNGRGNIQIHSKSSYKPSKVGAKNEIATSKLDATSFWALIPLYLFILGPDFLAVFIILREVMLRVTMWQPAHDPAVENKLTYEILSGDQCTALPVS